MNTWKQALQDGLVGGSAASALSTLALAAGGQRDSGSPCAPTNAISHWIWKDEAFSAHRPDLKHTLLGYLIHHGSSVFWATLHAKVFGRRGLSEDPTRLMTAALLSSAVACFVDYKLTPPRLQPGFEKHLSTTSMVAVYASFGLGLGLAQRWLERRTLEPGGRAPQQQPTAPPTA
jgi:hypothetical protein